MIDATGSVTKECDKINRQVFAGSLVRAAQGFLVHTGLLWRVNILRKTPWRFLVSMYQAPNSKTTLPIKIIKIVIAVYSFRKSALERDDSKGD